MSVRDHVWSFFAGAGGGGMASAFASAAGGAMTLSTFANVNVVAEAMGLGAVAGARRVDAEFKPLSALAGVVAGVGAVSLMAGLFGAQVPAALSPPVSESAPRTLRIEGDSRKSAQAIRDAAKQAHLVLPDNYAPKL